MATKPAAQSAAPAPAGKKKQVKFCGSSLDDLREFPNAARQDCGFQIDKVQNGEQPDNFKAMPTVGKGVEEICVTDEDGWFRVLYTARLADYVYVLHAFQKKTNQTSPKDIELGKKRYKDLLASLSVKDSK